MQQAGNIKAKRMRAAPRSRGAAAILAMIFLVIFSSLAASMAIIAQGNLSTADSHLRINRSLAAAESGIQFAQYMIEEVIREDSLNNRELWTFEGDITVAEARRLWFDAVDPQAGLKYKLNERLEGFGSNYQNNAAPLIIGPVEIVPGGPRFEIHIIQHPIGGGYSYDQGYYQRPPFTDLSPAVSDESPLDERFIRVMVIGRDGLPDREISRAIQYDFRIEKRNRYAVLSRSRIMIGRNVNIEGPVASTFQDTDLPFGHPIQMMSDFMGLDPDLDQVLLAFRQVLHTNDLNFDNRINLSSPGETADLPEWLEDSDGNIIDVNGDGYLDEFDFFLAHFDMSGDGKVDGMELGISGDPSRRQLFELLDVNGDGVIDSLDHYAKIRGQVMMRRHSYEQWMDALDARGQKMQEHYQGPIHPEHRQAPVNFDADVDLDIDLNPQYFAGGVHASKIRTVAGSFETQVQVNLMSHDPGDPDSPQYIPAADRAPEGVPYGTAQAYDEYRRPLYRNMTFTNVRIPKGTNALFENCTFEGVVFIETHRHNEDPMYNYAGSFGREDLTALVFDDALGASVPVTDTKPLANNIRFHGCTFRGGVAGDIPNEFTHVRNKIAMTGRTRFDLEGSPDPAFFRRSTIMMPHWSIEVGPFDAITPEDEIELFGTIVAGIIDMRGQVTVLGSIVTTFEPQQDVGPVMGATSPNFNTTIGYFTMEQGDFEVDQLPPGGIGRIRIRHDPTIPPPDGIHGAIELRPIRTSDGVVNSYFEVPAP
ncbi:MAG: EF-hand domain-containing protein [Phycisphaeraceae bacterium]|nr:EF-hand domain-containing protein [Phycisphaeraceae bacterium]